MEHAQNGSSHGILRLQAALEHETQQRKKLEHKCISLQLKLADLLRHKKVEQYVALELQHEDTRRELAAVQDELARCQLELTAVKADNARLQQQLSVGSPRTMRQVTGGSAPCSPAAKPAPPKEAKTARQRSWRSLKYLQQHQPGHGTAPAPAPAAEAQLQTEASGGRHTAAQSDIRAPLAAAVHSHDSPGVVQLPAAAAATTAAARPGTGNIQAPLPQLQGSLADLPQQAARQGASQVHSQGSSPGPAGLGQPGVSPAQLEAVQQEVVRLQQQLAEAKLKMGTGAGSSGGSSYGDDAREQGDQARQGGSSRHRRPEAAPAAGVAAAASSAAAGGARVPAPRKQRGEAQVPGGAGYTAGGGKGHRPQPTPRGTAGSLSQGPATGKARGLPGSRGKLAAGVSPGRGQQQQQQQELCAVRPSPGKNLEQQQRALMRLHLGLPTSC